MLNGKRRKEDIWDVPAARVSLLAQPGNYRPMPRAGHHHHRGGLMPHLLGKRESPDEKVRGEVKGLRIMQNVPGDGL